MKWYMACSRVSRDTGGSISTPWLGYHGLMQGKQKRSAPWRCIGDEVVHGLLAREPRHGRQHFHALARVSWADAG